MPIYQTIIIAFIFFGIAGQLTTFIAPIENQIFAEMRASVLNLSQIIHRCMVIVAESHIITVF